ncbi:MAG: hypothetical protein Q4A11_05550 [Brachymonas sp.]|nr:hypothetical protein [Brachymonas sp.]
MRAIKEARKLIEKNPDSEAAKILSQLVLALEAEGNFHIADIYQLNYHNFKLALEILQEWRIDRHFASKTKLFDASRLLAESTEAAEAAETPAEPATKKQKKSAEKSGKKSSSGKA